MHHVSLASLGISWLATTLPTPAGLRDPPRRGRPPGRPGMAGTELAKGGNADAKALAGKIIDAQQAEITEMRGLLAR